MNQPMQKEKILIEEFLDKELPQENLKPEVLHKAMRYAVLGGGKKLRSLLAVSACKAVGGIVDNVLQAGCAVELIHSYSLIHDDLPCMDDDDLRRGKPTCHKKFGETIALLAGDALLTLAFEWASKAKTSNPNRNSEITLELAKFAGHCGMVGGQVVDIEVTGAIPSAGNLRFIHQHKTADLITAAVVIGGIAGNASEKQIEFLRTFGINLGLAFQYIDDILDCTESSEMIGKTAGKDVAAGKTTAVSVFGIEGAKEIAEKHKTMAINTLIDAGWENSNLSEISEFVIGRSF
ncbi:MAG: polyprenyl synthetase family protein [Chlamydiae bacterium]|nr:MAG: polyprenyl synthetase family protein [Chlamydiota bacterium]